MSSPITKTSKRPASAAPTVRTTRGKKAVSKKPQSPEKLTAPPKSKKAAPTKSKKQVSAPKKPINQKSKKPLPKKKVNAAPAKAAKKPVTIKPSASAKMLPKTTANKRGVARSMVPPKPAPAPPKKAPSPSALAAVRAFEQALKLFNRHEYAAAKPAFVGLLDKYDDQADIVARARTYLAICDQRLARTPSAPRNPDALYDQGVFELNKNNFREAISLFEKALKAQPRADHVYYSLAAAYARLHDSPKALDALRRAIVIRSVHRSHARSDADFVSLHTNEDFQNLTGFGFDLDDE